MIKRNLFDLQRIPTSHGAGLKRVLIGNEETDSKITQIAITDLDHGAHIEEHINPDMDEYFYVMKDDHRMCRMYRDDNYADDISMLITIDGEITECRENDIVYVSAGSRHEMLAQPDVKNMTIGVLR